MDKQLRFNLIILLLLFVFNAKSQMYELAEKAKSVFPDNNIVLVSSKTTVEVSSYSKSEGLYVTETINERFINLNKNAQFAYPIFYGSGSSVEKFDCGKSGIEHDDEYTSESIFHDDVRVKWAEYNVMKHAYISMLDATLFYEDIKYYTKVFFTNEFPCLERQVQFIIPKHIDLELIPFNFDGFDIECTIEENRKAKIITYTVQNIDAYSRDEGLPGATYIYPHLLLHVKSYFNNNQQVTLFDGLNGLYNWYSHVVSEVNNDNAIIQSKVEELIKGKTTDNEKLESIFYWVQDNIRYIAIEDGIAGFRPESCQDVFNNTYGDCKGMANLLKQMLILAGFDARLVWIGTKHIAYDYSIPSLACDNHMICAVKRGNDFQFLDATEKYVNLGEYADRIQGRDVLIENGKDFIHTKIPESEYHSNLKEIKAEFNLDDDNLLLGRLQLKILGEERRNFQNYMSSISKSDHLDFIKMYISDFNSNVWFSNVDIPEVNYGQSAIEISADLNVKNSVSEFDGEKYVYVNPFKFYADKEFKDRDFDYWFGAKRFDKVSIEFTVPEEYKVKSLPKQLLVENHEFNLKFQCTQTNKTVEYYLEIAILSGQISKTNFTAWNEAIKQLKDNYDYPIILTKI